MNPGPYAKAIVAAAAAACAAAGTALQDGHITSAEWAVIAGAFLAALGVVYVVPNHSTSEPTPPAASTVPDPAPPTASTTPDPPLPARALDPVGLTPDAD